jgi:hypothetical protein
LFPHHGKDETSILPLYAADIPFISLVKNRRVRTQICILHGLVFQSPVRGSGIFICVGKHVAAIPESISEAPKDFYFRGRLSQAGIIQKEELPYDGPDDV